MKPREAIELRAENARLRAILAKVEEWMSREELRAPLFELWEGGDICGYDDNPFTWEQTLEQLRNPAIKAAILGHGVEWEAVTLYREVFAALRGEGKPDA